MKLLKLLLAAVIALSPVMAAADTLTPNLGLSKPGVGADDATWGALLNTNLDLVDGEYARTAKGDTAYTILSTDRFVALTASLTTPRAWTLPAASALKTGQAITIIDEAGGVSSTNTLTITAAGADTINGAATLVLKTARQVVVLRSDGTSKWTMLRSACPPSGCTFSGEIITAASTTTTAGLNIPAGTAPTSPVNGDVWSTTTGVLARVNGATHQLDTASVTGAVKNNGSGTVSQAACADLSDGGNGGCAAKVVSGSLTPTLVYDTAGTSSFSYATQEGAYVCVAGVVSGWIHIVFTPTNGTASGNLLWNNPPYDSNAYFSAVPPTTLGPPVNFSGTWGSLATTPYVLSKWNASKFAIMTISGTTNTYVTTSNSTTAASKSFNASFQYLTSAC